jgi:hypothetical protein
MRRRATELGGAEVDREEEQDAMVVPVSHAAAAVWCWASWAVRAGSGPDLGVLPWRSGEPARRAGGGTFAAEGKV